MRPTHLRTLICVLAIGLGASRALADQSAKDRATKLVREGADLYDQGDRLAAVARFEQAYKIYPSPAILYNLGKAYRGVGRNALAHRTLSRFLRTAKNVDASRRAEVERALRNVEGVIGLLVVSVSQPGLLVTIDGDEVGTTPLPAPVAVEPGVHQVAVLHKGNQLATKQVAAGTGKRVEVSLTVAPLPGGDVKIPGPADAAKKVPPEGPDLGLTKPPPRRSTPVYKKWWFWGAVGVVVVGGTVAAISMTGGEINDINPTLGTFEFGNNYQN